MKYYVFLSVQYNDGTDDKVAIYTYASANEAVAAFHSYLGSYMKSENVSQVLVIALNSDGGIFKNETYTAES